jgi:hypothetical protein
VAQEYPGSTATGEHAMSGLQRSVRRLYTGVITGDWSPPPALQLPPPPPTAGAPAGGSDAAAGQHPPSNSGSGLR